MRRLAPLIVLACFLAKPGEAGSIGRLSLEFDYAGAEAMLAAIERQELSDAAIDSLLGVRGVRAMVDNTINYFPVNTHERFRTDMQSFVRTRKYERGDFSLDWVHHYQDQIRRLLAELKNAEPELIPGIVAELTRYQPKTGDLEITVYFVVGGVSDGFVLDADPEPAFFVALDKASGDLAGVRQNMTHELYHVAQKAAARRIPGLRRLVDEPASLPPGERLLAQTLWEGTANYAADASKAMASGPYIDMWRDRYRRNAEPARVAENFALFDTVLAELREGRIDWAAVEKKGFSGNNDARFYFVGYEMAKSLERYHGSARIGRLFQESPVKFFKDYIALYRKHRQITARFAPATEAYITSLK